MPKAVLKFTGTQPTMDATLEFRAPRFPEIKDDFSNIIFLDMNGRKLPHWIEHDENMKPTGTVYVKVPFIDENGTSIVMYWDQGIDEGSGNIEETFLFGDDFGYDKGWVIDKKNSNATATISENILSINVPSNVSGGDIAIYFPVSFQIENTKTVFLMQMPNPAGVSGFWIPDSLSTWASGYDSIIFGNDGVNFAIVDDNWSQSGRAGSTDGYNSNWNIFEVIFSDTGDSMTINRETILTWAHSTARDAEQVIMFGAAADGYFYVDWVVTFSFLSPTPQLSHASLEHSLALWALLTSGVVKFFFGSNIFVAYLKQLLNSNEIDVSKLSQNDYTIESTNAFSDKKQHLENVFVPYIITIKPSGYINISKQLWEDYINTENIVFIDKLLNNTLHIIALSDKDQLPNQILIGEKEVKLPTEHISITYKQFLRFIEDITDAVEAKLMLLDQLTNTSLTRASYNITVQITELLSGLLASAKEIVAQLIGRTQASTQIIVPEAYSKGLSSKEASAYAIILNTAEQILEGIKGILKHPSMETIAVLEDLKHRFDEQISLLFENVLSFEERIAKPSESSQLSEIIDNANEVSKNINELIRNTEIAIDSLNEDVRISKDAIDILSTETKSGIPYKMALSSLEKLRKFIITITRTLVEKIVPHD